MSDNPKSEQSPPALDEIVREFNRAREELGKVAGTLREFETLAEERRAERATLEGSAAALADTAARLHTLTETLESAVSSVGEVLGAADSALQATDAGQLVERLTALDTSIRAEATQREEQASGFQHQVEARFGAAETLLQEVKSLTESQLHPLLQHHVVNTLGWPSLRPLQMRRWGRSLRR
jgi:ABC-type transporter Mla subunit MlaD